MKHSRVYTCEQLETRTVPTTFGISWGNQTISISFANDGTDVEGTSSNLYAHLEGNGWSRSEWQSEILRAFQSWAERSNLNFWVTNDSGQAFGTTGDEQGDARFGDIRIYARPLSDNVLAITSPPDGTESTCSGDIILNSNYLFTKNGERGGYDLYTVMLQEAGHALGIGNSSSTDSVMYTVYSGPRSGLNSSDVASVQAMYGSRTQDALEGKTDNNTQKNSSILSAPKRTKTSYQTIGFSADITTANDVDYYKVNIPSGAVSKGVTVRVSSAETSLLNVKVSIYNSKGNLLGSGETENLSGQTLDLRLPSSFKGGDIFIRVEASANSVFKVGAYDVSIFFDSTMTPAPITTSTASSDDKDDDDDEDSSTVELETTDGYRKQSHYQVDGVLSGRLQQDRYEVRSMMFKGKQTGFGTVNLRYLDSNHGTATIEVIDNQGRKVTTEVIQNDEDSYTVQFSNVYSDANYFIRVTTANNSPAVGKYSLVVCFQEKLTTYTTLTSDTLTSSNNRDFQKLTVHRSQVMNFILDVKAASNAGNTAVNMTMYDSAGNVVLTMTAKANQTTSCSVLLCPGEYTVVFSAGVRSGALGTVSYTLRGTGDSDPMGPGLLTSSGTSVDTTTTTTTTNTSTGATNSGSGSTSSGTSTTSTVSSSTELMEYSWDPYDPYYLPTLLTQYPTFDPWEMIEGL